MVRSVPEFSLVVIENNRVILNLRYGVAYRVNEAKSYSGGAVYG